MKVKILMFILCGFIAGNASANVLKNGLYYSRWIYDDHGVTKVYPVMANKYDKDANGVYLLPKDALNIGSEIYIMISNNKGSVFYRHVSNDGGAVTIGRGSLDIKPDTIVVKTNISNTFYDDGIPSDKFYISKSFAGKNVSMPEKERIPFKLVGISSFSVDCQHYLKINGYDENGLPDYEENDQSYNATVFATESGICSLFFDDDNVQQIKNGRIVFDEVK